MQLFGANLGEVQPIRPDSEPRPNSEPAQVVTAAPVAPAPVIPEPVAPAPVAPAPVMPAPVAPAPVIPAPVASVPVAPAPVTPVPVAPAPVTRTPVNLVLTRMEMLAAKLLVLAVIFTTLAGLATFMGLLRLFTGGGADITAAAMILIPLPSTIPLWIVYGFAWALADKNR